MRRTGQRVGRRIGRALRTHRAAGVLAAVVVLDAQVWAWRAGHLALLTPCCLPGPAQTDAARSPSLPPVRVCVVDGGVVLVPEGGREPPGVSVVGAVRVAGVRRQSVGLLAPWIDLRDAMVLWIDGPDGPLGQGLERDVRLQAAALAGGDGGGCWEWLSDRLGRCAQLVWLGVAHDAAALVVWGALVYSLAGVRGWDVWERVGVSGRARALRSGRCPGCGYDIRGLRGTECPECGQTWTRSEVPWT